MFSNTSLVLYDVKQFVFRDDGNLYIRQVIYIKLTIQAYSHNHCFRAKAISITYAECVSLALVTQHAVRMRHIILSYVACPVLPHFSTLSHKRDDLLKESCFTQNVC